MKERLGWAFGGAMALLAVLALARAMEAGPVDPPGPVGSTMRRVDELLPSWNQSLTAQGSDACNTPRFECTFPDLSSIGVAAVLDRETGLVWQRVPDTTQRQFANAYHYCAQLSLGGKYGWRLPAVNELASLLLADAPGPFELGLEPWVFWTWVTSARPSRHSRGAPGASVVAPPRAQDNGHAARL